MKNSTAWKWILLLNIQILMTSIAFGGDNKTVMSTDNNAQTYDNGLSVIIGWTPSQTTPPGTVPTQVTLTTTCDAGDTLTVNAGNYHCSQGVTMVSGYPTGSGSSRVVAKFQLDSTTIGKKNTISLDPPTHTTLSSGGSGGPTTCNSPSGQGAHLGGVTFNVNVLQGTFIDFFCAAASATLTPDGKGNLVFGVNVFPHGHIQLSPVIPNAQSNAVATRMQQYIYGQWTVFYKNGTSHVYQSPNGLDTTVDDPNGDITYGEKPTYNSSNGQEGVDGSDNPNLLLAGTIINQIDHVVVSLQAYDYLQYQVNGGAWIIIGSLQWNFNASCIPSTGNVTGGVPQTKGQQDSN